MKKPIWSIALWLLCLAPIGGGAQQTAKAEPPIAEKPEESFILLMLPQVRKELKMTEPQIARIEAVQKSLTEAEAPTEATEGRPPAEDTKENDEEKADRIRAKALNETMTETQRKRLHQIMLQARGPALLLRPDTVKTLELTDEQQAKMQTILKRYQTERRKPSIPGEAPKVRMRHINQLRTDAEDEMLLLLTTKQRERWQEYVGDRFDLTASASA